MRYCGNQIYPTAETVFKKLAIPLKIWFEIIRKLSEKMNHMSVREIKKEFELTYNTASRMLRKITDFINTHPSDIFIGNFLNI